jgi:hypothetical protein
VSSRRTDAPNALWLFRDTDLGAPEPVAAPVRPPPREPRKSPRKPRNARSGRDLFTAVATSFARSSEAARSEHEPAAPRPSGPERPELAPVSPTSLADAARPVPQDIPALSPLPVPSDMPDLRVLADLDDRAVARPRPRPRPVPA